MNHKAISDMRKHHRYYSIFKEIKTPYQLGLHFDLLYLNRFQCNKTNIHIKLTCNKRVTQTHIKHLNNIYYI